MKTKLTIVMLAFCVYAKAQTAIAYDVIIDEIFADPMPQVGLPNSEFIELRNTSAKAFNLNGWRIGDASSSALINVNYILQPDSFVVLCANSAASSFSVYGPVIGVTSFPSLDNEGDQISIRSKEGRTIHAVSYSSNWYKNAVKSQGGWSLEMIDSHNPCSGESNWTSSTDAKGGTPAKKNSVDGINKDLSPPMLVKAWATDSQNLFVVFDEPVDSGKAAVAANYSISDGIGNAISATPVAPLFNTVQLKTVAQIQNKKVYTVTVNAVADCAGNSIGNFNTVKFGLAAVADSFDVVINEILFNPKPNGADYIELYNRSNSIIDLKNFYIANRSATGAIGTPLPLSAENRLLLPAEYVAITTSATAVQSQYTIKDFGALINISSLPSMPDDKGDVLILNAQGKIIDELAYDAHWHFQLISDDEGVALERIDYNGPTQLANNWHSAATSAGYGTPGYQNSQFRSDLQAQGTIMLSPQTFSPDNDGFDDFLTINYQFPESGYVCNITAFDANGRIVRHITRNALCAQQGYYRWDGLDDKNNKLPIGVYVIYAEIFNLQGKTKKFKQAVTLARRLN